MCRGNKLQTGISVGVHNFLKILTDIDKVCAHWVSRLLRDHERETPARLSEGNTCFLRNRASNVVSRIDDVIVLRICVGTYFAQHVLKQEPRMRRPTLVC